MHLFGFSTDAPDPAQSSVVWYTKVVIQNKVFQKYLKNQCWKQFKKNYNAKAKGTNGIGVCVKHCIKCGMLRQWHDFGSI